QDATDRLNIVSECGSALPHGQCARIDWQSSSHCCTIIRTEGGGSPALGRQGLKRARGMSVLENEASVQPSPRVQPQETGRNGIPAPAHARPAERLASLDAYRGFTMLAMVSSGLGMAHLLSDPNWGWLADQMGHRFWAGCTFWDLIQPSFMFIVGVAMPF